MLRWTLVWVPLVLGFFAAAQPKALTATKAVEPPVMDGLLTDPAWQQAPIATNFVQYFPEFNKPASKKTEVRVLYDNEALYVAAHIYDKPADIRKQITARDGEQQQDADYFAVFLDTYFDLQNGFQFLVTSTNVQTDAKLNPNGGNSTFDLGDKSWDAVWQSKTAVTTDGWTVEMRIPYISLRFAKKDVQTWGINFLRFSRATNESSYWNPVDPNVNGFVNQFGTYTGLRNIEPPLRLSFSPYVTTGVRFNPEGSTRATEWLRNGGMDVKYGVNESFTLDATLIPDFGQVISDNLINNLSPFEVQFQENRPFFSEGTELFNKAGLFYSRRIGATPGGYSAAQQFAANNPDYQLVSNPTITQLYNAIKFSGRTRKKLGIGIFNAVTAPAQARLVDINSKQDTLIETEPLTNYNILVLDQPLKNRSSLTFTNTNVIRNGAARDANVSAVSWSLFTRDNQYRLSGTARYSKIFGFTPYTGSVNLVYDTVRQNGLLLVNPYDGYNAHLRLAKVSGLIQYFVSGDVKSHTYDPTDLGFLQSANGITYNASISYNEFKPKGNYLQYRHSLNARLAQLYKPYAFNSVEFWYSGFFYFKNFWDLSVNIGGQPQQSFDYFELRTPGRYMARPAFQYLSVNGSSDSRKALFVNFGGGITRTDIEDGIFWTANLGARYRFSDKLTLSLNLSRQYDLNQVGYAFVRENTGEPIIGYRRFVEFTSLLSGIYNFTPRLNVTLRARHYWNKIDYKKFFNVDAKGEYVPRAFYDGLDGNYNIYNLDAFLTWDFQYGSRLIFGWKNWLGNPFAVDGASNPRYLDNLGGIFRASHGNELSIRFIYFLDYNQLKKKSHKRP